MKKKVIKIKGCDATTYIREEEFGKPFTHDEKIFLNRLSKVSEKCSSYQCEPIIDFDFLEKWEEEYYFGKEDNE